MMHTEGGRAENVIPQGQGGDGQCFQFRCLGVGRSKAEIQTRPNPKHLPQQPRTGPDITTRTSVSRPHAPRQHAGHGGFAPHSPEHTCPRVGRKADRSDRQRGFPFVPAASLSSPNFRTHGRYRAELGDDARCAPSRGDARTTPGKRWL